MYITNAFSLNMLNDVAYSIDLFPVSIERAREIVSRETYVESAIGHSATATIVSTQLGVDVPMNRISVSFGRGNAMLVAQLTGQRLQEGQILSEEEMQQYPVQYWYITSDEDSPEEYF